MNNKGNSSLYLVIAGLGLALLFAGSYGAYNAGKAKGTTLTYSAANSRIETYNFQDGVIADLNGVRYPLSGLLSYSDNISPTPAAVASSTTGTTTVTVAGAAIGDLVLISSASTTPYTANGLGLTAQVTAASSVTVMWHNNSGANITVATSTIRMRVLPFASFAAPAALGSATTTAGNR